MYLIDKQLTEYEFEMLAKTNSKLVEQMILQRIRVYEKITGSSSFVNEIIDYISANARHDFYIKREYQRVTLYFVSPIDKENVTTFISTQAKNIES